SRGTRARTCHAVAIYAATWRIPANEGDISASDAPIRGICGLVNPSIEGNLDSDVFRTQNQKVRRKLRSVTSALTTSLWSASSIVATTDPPRHLGGLELELMVSSVVALVVVPVAALARAWWRGAAPKV